MQNKFIPAILCLLLVTTACTENKNDTGSKKSKQQEENPAPPSQNPEEDKTFVCYLSTCIATIGGSEMQGNLKDYKYPDKNGFPQRNMRPQYQSPENFIDITAHPSNLRIAPNFILKDFVSASKGRYGIFSSFVLTRLQEIRNELGQPVFVTSGYRSPGYNSRIDGSAKWSRHTYGDAVDFAVSDVAPKDLAAFCQRRGSSFYQVYKTHIHCDWRKEKLDPAFYANEDKSAPAPETDVARALAQESELSWQDNADNRVVFFELPFYEDEGEITYRWKVKLPNGDLLESEEPSVVLPRLSGVHYFSVVIGESVTINKAIQW